MLPRPKCNGLGLLDIGEVAVRRQRQLRLGKRHQTMENPVLNHAELEKLMGLLSDVTKPFGQLKGELNSCFRKTQEKFRAASAICILLQDELLVLPERLVGFYLLSAAYQDGTGEAHLNPFLPFFLEGLRACWNEVDTKVPA